MSFWGVFVVDVSDNKFFKSYFKAKDIEYYRSMFEAVEAFKKYCKKYKNKKGRWEIFLTYAIRSFTFNSKTNIGLIEHFSHDIHTDMSYYVLIDKDDGIHTYGKDDYNVIVEAFHLHVNDFTVDSNHEDDDICIYLGATDCYEIYENE